jgi:DNA modification methylase
MGYEYVGCELDPEYVEIANARISAWEKKFDTPANKLFD